MSRACGIDFGTMFFQTAEQDGEETNIKRTRNAFIELAESDDDEDMLEHQKPFFVQTDPQEGLSFADYERLLEILAPKKAGK